MVGFGYRRLEYIIKSYIVYSIQYIIYDIRFVGMNSVFELANGILAHTMKQSFLNILKEIGDK